METDRAGAKALEKRGRHPGMEAVQALERAMTDGAGIKVHRRRARSGELTRRWGGPIMEERPPERNRDRTHLAHRRMAGGCRGKMVERIVGRAVGVNVVAGAVRAARRVMAVPHLNLLGETTDGEGIDRHS